MPIKQIFASLLIATVSFGSGYSTAKLQIGTGIGLPALSLQDAVLAASKKQTVQTLGSNSKIIRKMRKRVFSQPVQTPANGEAPGITLGAFEPVTPVVVKIRGQTVPKDLLELLNDTTAQETIRLLTSQINGTITEGPKLTQTQTEDFVRGLFSQAATDTGEFASQLVKRYGISQAALAALKGKDARRDLEKQVKAELENYAKQEINKLANQAVAQFIPQLSFLTIDYTDLNSKTVKASIRNSVVNALAQSYLGPQYVMFYLVFETFFPKEAQKVHAELRRFDKKYIRPATDDIEDEINRSVKRLKAEWDRQTEQLRGAWKKYMNYQRELLAGYIALQKDAYQKARAEFERAPENVKEAAKQYVEFNKEAWDKYVEFQTAALRKTQAEFSRLPRNLEKIAGQYVDFNKDAWDKYVEFNRVALDKTKKEIGRLPDNLKEAGQAYYNFHKEAWDKYVEFNKTAIDKTVKEIGRVPKNVEEAAKKFVDLNKEGWNKYVEFNKTAAEKTVKEFNRIDDNLKKARDKVQAELGRVGDKIGNEAGRVGGKISDEWKRRKKKWGL